VTGPEPVRGRPRETALSLVVPQAEPVVGDFRRRFNPTGVTRRIPPHVTLLYPFVAADRVDAALIESIRELYAGAAPFAFELAYVGRFEAHVWLGPEPKAWFVELIRLTWARFPECPPYGGEFAGEEPKPHLTIGEANGTGVDALAAIAERELGGRLPVVCAAGAVSLLEEQADGTWKRRAEFTLGAT
jgi:2'-5' RNA ligase